ncbi:MAG: Trm112 family protein [Chitinivibrionales bacterium]|nr:Trm112 family protein [Chitinivibrionales bacterium]
MVDKELLDILCCPETKEDVHLVEGDVIDKINKKIDEGTVKNRGGEPVKEKIDAGLLREDKKYLYPIREDIPIMLIDEAIPFDEFV